MTKEQAEALLTLLSTYSEAEILERIDGTNIQFHDFIKALDYLRAAAGLSEIAHD